MSRGLGIYQRTILEHLAKGPLSSGKLYWSVFDVIGPRHDEKNKVFYVGFRRALSTLQEHGRVHAGEARLQSTQEIIAEYPYRTTERLMKTIRLRLLPYLEKFLAESWPRFPSADNERHFMGRELDHTALRSLASQWRPLELEIASSFVACSDEPQRESLRHLLAKGSEHFLRHDQRGEDEGMFTFSLRPTIRGTGSLGEAIESAATTKSLSADTIARLRTFYDNFFPPEQRRRLSLKSQLYAAAYFGSDASTPYLTDDFCLYLLKAERDFVLAQPDNPPDTRPIPSDPWARSPEIRDHDWPISPTVKRMIGRDVFKPHTVFSATNEVRAD